MKHDNKTNTNMIGVNESELIDSNCSTHKFDENKNSFEWDRTKNFLFSHKRFILSLFPVILASLFLGSICSSLYKNGYTLLFTITLICVILLLSLSIFLVHKSKKKLLESNMPLSVLFYIIFIYMFISSFILMLLFKIISMINASNILNLTGLISVIIIVLYFLLLIASVFVDFRKIIHIFKIKNTKPF